MRKRPVLPGLGTVPPAEEHDKQGTEVYLFGHQNETNTPTGEIKRLHIWLAVSLVVNTPAVHLNDFETSFSHGFIAFSTGEQTDFTGRFMYNLRRKHYASPFPLVYTLT